MMVDLMGLLLELLTNTIVLVIQPFTLLKLACIFGGRAVILVTHSLLQLPKAFINFHVDMCGKIIIWGVAIVTLPVRVITAIQRERLLEMHLQDMQIELENVAWSKKELEERLHIAIQDCKIMASVLDELEEEHEKAIAKIELLENELQDLNDENLRLKEIHGKCKWDFKVQEDHDRYGYIRNDDKQSIPYITEYNNPPPKSVYNTSGVIIGDILMHRDAWDEETKLKSHTEDVLTLESQSVFSLPEAIIPKCLSVDEALELRRRVALSQSLFSATLSLLVGIIVWTAEDPCMPLVVALFTVVGMSLKSVVQFFSTINNRPAFDAVALLSSNWFILGTLTYPTLPRIAHVLIPVSVRLADQMVTWLGFSSFLQIE